MGLAVDLSIQRSVCAESELVIAVGAPESASLVKIFAVPINTQFIAHIFTHTYLKQVEWRMIPSTLVFSCS